jgi:hypothetical protein
MLTEKNCIIWNHIIWSLFFWSGEHLINEALLYFTAFTSCFPVFRLLLSGSHLGFSVVLGHATGQPMLVPHQSCWRQPQFPECKSIHLDMADCLWRLHCIQSLCACVSEQVCLKVHWTDGYMHLDKYLSRLPFIKPSIRLIRVDTSHCKVHNTWYDAQKPEEWSQNRRSLLGNDSVNTFPWQQIHKQQSSNFCCYAMAL